MTTTPTCAQCNDPVVSFVQVDRQWQGHPVLYMGRHPATNVPLAFDFCDPECLLEWLCEVTGEELVR